jgi:hypothetical protein
MPAESATEKTNVGFCPQIFPSDFVGKSDLQSTWLSCIVALGRLIESSGRETCAI